MGHVHYLPSVLAIPVLTEARCIRLMKDLYSGFTNIASLISHNEQTSTNSISTNTHAEKNYISCFLKRNGYTLRGSNSASFISVFLLHWGQLLKETICFSWSKLFPLKVNPKFSRAMSYWEAYMKSLKLSLLMEMVENKTEMSEQSVKNKSRF